LVEIRDQFEALDRRLQDIDARHSQFVAAAVRAVELQLAAGSTTSGQLHGILQTLFIYPRVYGDRHLGYHVEELGNQGRIEFNKLAQDHSERNLDSYVRGKIGEDRWLRPGNTVAYVALEFSDRQVRR
jgi:hypothetical protein